jgi:hypothetical protein
VTCSECGGGGEGDGDGSVGGGDGGVTGVHNDTVHPHLFAGADHQSLALGLGVVVRLPIFDGAVCVEVLLLNKR